MQLPRPPFILLAALALALACTHTGERPASPTEEPTEEPTRASASAASSPAAGGPAAATDSAPTASGAEPAAEDEDCAAAKEGQPCRAPYQHCPLSCDDACSPCALLICEDGTWHYQEEFPEPTCGEDSFD